MKIENKSYYMKNILILSIVFLFMQIGSYLLFIDILYAPSFIFLIGYYTYPFIKYLQHENRERN